MEEDYCLENKGVWQTCVEEDYCLENKGVWQTCVEEDYCWENKIKSMAEDRGGMGMFGMEYDRHVWKKIIV